MATGPTNQQGAKPQPGSTSPVGQPIGPLPADTTRGQVAETIPVWANFHWIVDQLNLLQEEINNLTPGGGGTFVREVDTEPPILGGPITNQGTISHALSGVVADRYGDELHVAQIQIDKWGHVTHAVNVPISGGGSVTNVTGIDPIVVTNPTTTPVVSILTFGASGPSHDRGAVPDPGSSAGITRFLREDASWQVPAGGLVSPLTTKGDIWGFSTVDARVPVGTDTFVFTADSAQGLGVKWAPAGVPNLFSTVWAYGDGSDGSFTLDGVAIPAWATLSGTTYTMTRDCYMVNLTLNVGITLGTVGRRIFGQGTFTCNGLVSTNGFSGGGASAGNGATGANWYIQSQAGGGGGNPGNGGAGVSTINSCVLGAGGKGGDSGVRTGGNSGGVGTFSSRDGGNRHICDTFPTIFWGTCPSGAQIAAGPGGGGGAGDGATRAGGGGGGSAGIIGLFFFKIAGSGTLQANGGNGAAGQIGGAIGCGGGGGGPGGALFIITTTLNYASLVTVDLSGGNGGLGTIGGANGANGSTGFTYQMFTY